MEFIYIHNRTPKSLRINGVEVEPQENYQFSVKPHCIAHIESAFGSGELQIDYLIPHIKCSGRLKILRDTSTMQYIVTC